MDGGVSDTVAVAAHETEQPTKSTADAPPRQPRPKKPNYAKLHENPLPLTVCPVPAFIPHNPVSLLRASLVLISHFVFPPSSHPSPPHVGIFSPSTRSVTVTDARTARALWESGFFGKGSLSRSEPTWLAQERRRRGLDGGLTSEMATQRRRGERLAMKRERARREREAVELQLDAEGAARADGRPPAAAQGARPNAEAPVDDILPRFSDAWAPNAAQQEISTQETPTSVISHTPQAVPEPNGSEVVDSTTASEPQEVEIKDQEHLQLTLEEAFFLAYGLGALQVSIPGSAPATRASAMPDLLQLFRQCSYFPPAAAANLRPDDPFLTNYAAYHHFRSLGWVVRPGNKFAVDFLLYRGGPVFSHAEFAVAVVPAYDDPAWAGSPEAARARDERPWWWV
ncbi:MAG: hypothetical protein INR71_07985, partial [Terriglobus roseus]|nr:hypothetical protein [Terriglobus roseus]